MEWNYLNKGTHEADKKEEFDAPAVKDLLSLLTKMDAGLSAGANPAPALARAAVKV